MLIRALFLASVVSAASPIVMHDDGRAPEGWSVVRQPGSEVEWSCANQSQEEWAVSGDSPDNTTISPYQHRHETRLALSDGDLIGTNHGEFGGKIEWVGRDGARHVLVHDKKPVAFTRRGDDVFVATGLAHMSVDDGQIIKLHRASDGSWQVSTVMDIGEAPNAGVRIGDATWILLTTNGVSKVDLSKLALERLYRNDNWWRLHPNSIQQSGQSWLIGARRAVIRITPDDGGYKETWLAPVRCKHLVGPNCECAR